MMGIFYKTVFDISCFYAFASFFFYYAVGYETNALSFCVFLVSALVLAFAGSRKQNGKKLAVIAAVIPAAALVMETTTVGRAEVLLVWAYLIISIYKESYLIYYYHFLDKFKGFLWSLLVPFVFVFLDFEKGIAAAELAIPYLVIFLAAGVMTLQAARHRATAESRKQFEKYQIFQTVFFFIVCFLLTAANLLELFYDRIIRPAVAALINAIFKLVGAAFAVVPDVDIDWSIDREGFEEAKSQEEAAEIFVEGNTWAQMIQEKVGVPEETDMTPILICLGVIVGIILLIILMSNAAKTSRIAALAVEREDLPEEEQNQKKAKNRFFHPEAAVRHYYRQFMKQAVTREQELEKSDTTAEIKDKYNAKASAKPEAAEQITEIYRQIRYGGKTATREDATKMRMEVKKL